MDRAIKTILSAIITAIYISTAFAQTPAEKPVQHEQKIRLTSFHLRSGQLAAGRVLDDDKNLITLAQPSQSQIVITTYSRKDIVPATLSLQLISETDYYLQLARLFEGQTGDFENDTDDFIQAARFYEKALFAARDQLGQNHSRTQSIQKDIEKLSADRKRWTQEIANRAQLKNTEFQATFDQRLTDLENKIAQNATAIAAIEQNTQAMKNDVVNTNNNLTRDIQWLRNETAANRKNINDIESRRPIRVYYDDPYNYPPVYNRTKNRYLPSNFPSQNQPQTPTK